VGEVEPERLEAAARHRHRQARAVGWVLEREEHALPAGMAPELGHLALDPERRQPREPVGHAAVERRHGVDLAVAVLDRRDLHAADGTSEAPLAVTTIRTCGLCPRVRLNRPVDTIAPRGPA